MNWHTKSWDRVQAKWCIVTLRSRQFGPQKHHVFWFCLWISDCSCRTFLKQWQLQKSLKSSVFRTFATVSGSFSPHVPPLVMACMKGWIGFPVLYPQSARLADEDRDRRWQSILDCLGVSLCSGCVPWVIRFFLFSVWVDTSLWSGVCPDVHDVCCDCFAQGAVLHCFARKVVRAVVQSYHFSASTGGMFWCIFLSSTTVTPTCSCKE